MGYFSQWAIEKKDVIHFDRELIPPRHDVSEHRDHLEYQLDILRRKLKNLEMCRPRDPLHPDYDRFFYSAMCRHYYEDPETAQDLLFGINEIEERLWVLMWNEQETSAERIRLAEMENLSKNIDEQLLMVTYWDYAAIFKEAATYRSVLSVLKQ